MGLSPDSGPVDVYVTQSTDITNSPATVGPVSYTALSSYAKTAAGTFQIIITVTGTKDILFQSSPISLAAGSIYTVAIFPSGGGKLANALLLTQGPGGSGTLMLNPRCRVKAVNAVPDSTAINFKADGTALLSNVPYSGNSSYVTLAAGARTLQIEVSNVPGTVIASLPQQVDAARDYSVIATNSIAEARSSPSPTTTRCPRAASRRCASPTPCSADRHGRAGELREPGEQPALPERLGLLHLRAALNYTITFATPGACRCSRR